MPSSASAASPTTTPAIAVPEWDRKQGNASLGIEAGSAIDPRPGDFLGLGLLYGEKPRLVLIRLATEAVRTDLRSWTWKNP